MSYQRRLDKSIMLCIFVYIAWMLFYGIIIKITIGNSFLFFIKTYVTDAMLVLIFLLCTLRRRAVTKDEFIFVTFILYAVVVNLIEHGNSEDNIVGLLYTIRGFIAPMMVGYCLYNVEIDKECINTFFRRLYFLSIIFLFGNTVLSVMQAQNGYTWTSQFYTGYSFYGTDPYSNIRITMAAGLLRTPGLPASFTSSSMYSLISLIVILTAGKNKSFKILSIILAFVSIWLTYNKTVLILFAIILVMHLFSKMPHTFRYMIFLAMGGTLLLAFILVTTHMGIGVDEGDLMFSTFARVEFWLSLGEVVSPIEVLIPYNMFKYTANGEGMLACWDNFYLYALFSFGIVGLFCFLKLSFKMVKKNIQRASIYHDFYLYLAIMFYMAAIFNNVSNGKSFLGIFILINGLVWRRNSNKYDITTDKVDGGITYERRSINKC